jgi:hypothetical protein
MNAKQSFGRTAKTKLQIIGNFDNLGPIAAQASIGYRPRDFYEMPGISNVNDAHQTQNHLPLSQPNS